MTSPPVQAQVGEVPQSTERDLSSLLWTPMQQVTAVAGSPRTPSVHARCQRLPAGSPEGSPAHVPQSTTNLPKTHKSRQQVPQSTERDVFRRCSGRLGSVVQALQAHHEPPDCNTMHASPILPIAKDSPHHKSPSPRPLPRSKTHKSQLQVPQFTKQDRPLALRWMPIWTGLAQQAHQKPPV